MITYESPTTIVQMPTTTSTLL